MGNNNKSSNEEYINDYLKLRFERKGESVVSISVVRNNGEILESTEVEL